jgi:hypothetical protein
MSKIITVVQLVTLGVEVEVLGLACKEFTEDQRMLVEVLSFPEENR